MTTDAVTEDALLGGRVVLRQPAAGYRAGIDPVFLAAAVPAKAGDKVLDVGCGVGAAALCLAARAGDVQVTGIDVEPVLIRLAAENARASGLGDCAEFFTGDLRQPPSRLAPAAFEHVMANPPYIAAGQGRSPADAAKARAMMEDAGGLERWLRFCLLMVRPKGRVTLIHRADRLDDLLVSLKGRLGALTVIPLWSSADATKPAKRVIVHGCKDSKAPLALMPGLLLHQPDGRYTPAAERILRDAAALG